MTTETAQCTSCSLPFTAAQVRLCTQCAEPVCPLCVRIDDLCKRCLKQRLDDPRCIDEDPPAFSGVNEALLVVEYSSTDAGVQADCPELGMGAVGVTRQHALANLMIAISYEQGWDRGAADARAQTALVTAG